jgi:hypothetical protein
MIIATVALKNYCEAFIPIACQSDSEFRLTEMSYTSEWVNVTLPWSESIVPLH